MYSRGEQAVEYAECRVEPGTCVVAEKFVCTRSTRETAAGALRAETVAGLRAFVAEGHGAELAAHGAAWEALWNVADISIEGDAEADKALRFNVFQLLAAGPAHSPTVSIGAKGLTGERYIGHVFWDTEIFMMPFYAYVDPQTARHLLMYRHHTLGDARRRAAREGRRGAQFPWQATDTGFETTRKWGVHPDGRPFRRWWGEEEIHITADVAYAVHDYYRITGDVEFLKDCGAELLVETARFWVSRCEYNGERDRYEIHTVIGPDEFHLHVNNNAFTNGMARWNIGAALEVVGNLRREHPAAYRRLEAATCLTAAELLSFAEVRDKLFVPLDEGTGLIEQFDGYFSRRDCRVIKRPGGVRSLPPDVDPDDPDPTQIVKQADVVILLLLLDDAYDERVKKANFNYYEERTLHESTLSASSYAMVGLRIGDATRAYEYFLRSARNDYGNPKADATHGIHLAAAGGAWQTAVYGFAGLRVDRDGVLCLRPQAPAQWRSMRFRVLWRGNLLEIRICQTEAEVTVVQRRDPRVRIRIRGRDVVV
jgi:kojibiose phosphorylase